LPLSTNYVGASLVAGAMIVLALLVAFHAGAQTMRTAQHDASQV
jgi:hypothetical protein